MGKKKRLRKISIFGAVEGDSEAVFLEYIKCLYFDSAQLNMPDDPNCGGGNPDTILNKALKKNDRKRSFLWIDEDKDLCPESRKKLLTPWNLSDKNEKEILSVSLCKLQKTLNPENRNPVLIVSQPVCFEGFICRVLGIDCKHKVYDETMRAKQISDLKSAAMLGKIEDQLEFYVKNLDKAKLEGKRKEIPELDMLISLVSPKA